MEISILLHTPSSKASNGTAGWGSGKSEKVSGCSKLPPETSLSLASPPPHAPQQPRATHGMDGARVFGRGLEGLLARGRFHPRRSRHRCGPQRCREQRGRRRWPRKASSDTTASDHGAMTRTAALARPDVALRRRRTRRRAACLTRSTSRPPSQSARGDSRTTSSRKRIGGRI